MFLNSFKFPFFVTRRYLKAKKSHSAINIISLISLFGIAVGTMALIVVLSVFNGFNDLIKSLFNSFDPDIKITIVEGKSFVPDSTKYAKIKAFPFIEGIAESVEENVLIQYGEKQYIAAIKGVTNNFNSISGIDKRITEGKFLLNNGKVPYAIVGQGVAYYLSVGLNLGDPLVIYVPRRSAEVSFIPEEAVNKKYIMPSGIFSIEQDFDAKYVLVPINFAREILEYTREVTALEIKVKKGENIEKVQKEIENILGPTYQVKNRYQQQEIFYKIMASEKWAIFFILTFILIVASLNVIGSLTMLILDKKKDISTLSHLGADWKTIRKIFLLNGWINSLFGALTGIVLGILICWLQMRYGFVKLQGSGTFVIDVYPVKIILYDILMVLITVLFIGYITSWIPVRVISKKYFE
jgi:lipoprotein-releasing system permease protein